jgi:uncharacterized iron-regulated membrane protein
LWVGLVLGLYAVIVCVSGSAIVFRNELVDYLQAKRKVEIAGTFLPEASLRVSVEQANPGWHVDAVRFADPDEVAEVDLSRSDSHKTRLVNPYNAQDHGPSVSTWFKLLRWLGDLHGKLLWEERGLELNGIGGYVFTAVCLTGLLIWWPGVGRVGRALMIKPSAGWRRFNWDLHSALGFWTFALLAMWGLTGAYFVYPQPFRSAIEVFTPINPPRLAQPTAAQSSGKSSPGVSTTPPPVPGGRRPRRPPTTGQKILRGFSNAHYGNFGGWPVKVLWMILGCTPLVLLVTALILWWRRVVKPALARTGRREKTELIST